MGSGNPIFGVRLLLLRGGLRDVPLQLVKHPRSQGWESISREEKTNQARKNSGRGDIKEGVRLNSAVRVEHSNLKRRGKEKRIIKGGFNIFAGMDSPKKL